MARRVERAFPPEGRLLEVGGTPVHYIDEGEGPPVVLVNGLGGHARNFTHSLVGPLADPFRVVVVDRPGSGYSPRPRGASAALGPQADVVAAVIGRWGWSGRCWSATPSAAPSPSRWRCAAPASSAASP